jgi:hypothetical protein
VALISTLLVSTTPAEAASTPSLPFDMPSTNSLRSSPKKIFANWVPSLPVSIDNKAPASDYYAVNYLTPNGEGGKHAAYGGFLRDRPLGRAPIDGNWRLEDMKTEVRNAIAAGIDGFTVVMYGFPGSDSSTQQWNNVRLMLEAAEAVDSGFKIIPMPDMTSSLYDADVNSMSARMAELAKFGSAYRINGKLVLSPFTAEQKSVGYWSSVISTMTNNYNTPVAFFPTFQNESKYAPSFDSISYGMGTWGDRDPAYNSPTSTSPTGPIGRITSIKALGQLWMHPISLQDVRPRSAKYWESNNTENLRNTWEVARKSGADWAQLTTWNDLPEGSGMLPSAQHGFSFLDLNAYYGTWFKTGEAPKIVRDAVYLTHRKQKISAPISFPQSLKMSAAAGASSGRDTVEALTFSRAPGTVEITTGGKTTSCAVDAGVDTCVVPLGIGTVSAKLIRSGTPVATLTSPFTVDATPNVQDFEYVGSSSLRQGTSSSAPVAISDDDDSEPATGTTSVQRPLWDTFAEQSNPSKNHGDDITVVAGGSPANATYLRFAIPAPPSGKRLTGAVLMVRTNYDGSAGSPDPYTVSVVGGGWNEDGLTWNNRPPVGAEAGTLTASQSAHAYSIKLDASDLQTSVNSQVSLMIAGSSGNGLSLLSRENPDVNGRPYLTLTYS